MRFELSAFHRTDLRLCANLAQPVELLAFTSIQRALAVACTSVRIHPPTRRALAGPAREPPCAIGQIVPRAIRVASLRNPRSRCRCTIDTITP
jgi:hypothetical protein